METSGITETFSGIVETTTVKESGLITCLPRNQLS